MSRPVHPFLVDVLELVDAAQRRGFGLTALAVRDAARRGELPAAQQHPLLFTTDAANRWLTAWMRAETRARVHR